METVTHILIENQEKGVGNLTKVMPTSPVFLSVLWEGVVVQGTWKK